MSPNVEQPLDSATSSSGHSETDAALPSHDSPRPESPRLEPQWTRPAARPKSSPGGRPLPRSGGWDEGEALVLTDVEGEAAGVAGGGWDREVHTWTPHPGPRGGHDDGDEDEVSGNVRSAKGPAT